MPMFKAVYSTVIEVVEEFYANDIFEANAIAENRANAGEVGDIDADLNYGVDSVTLLY